jgi:hypothetical protein
VTAERRLAAVAAVVLALGLLAGCGDDEGDAEESPGPSLSATEAGATDDYLPVPEGVTLTPPGTRLGLGDTGTVAWRPRQDTVIVLDVVVERIDLTSYEESFEGWVVTRQMRDLTPYFVHVSTRNVGDRGAGGVPVPLYGVDDAAILVEPLEFVEKVFEPCPGRALPRRLPPGARTTLCLVYLAPAGRELVAVAFDPVGDLEPVTWSGRITRIEKPGKTDGKGRRERG